MLGNKLEWVMTEGYGCLEEAEGASSNVGEMSLFWGKSNNNKIAVMKCEIIRHKGFELFWDTLKKMAG